MRRWCPQLNQQTWQVFLWVRGVTCCLNFHVSLISSVSQWSWHLMPLKNGIMNLFLRLSLRVWGLCVYSMRIVYSAPPRIRKNPLYRSYRRVWNGTFSSWGDEGIFSSMTELIVLSYLNCQHGGGSAAAEYQALLSDSPWELGLQHCLAVKHTYICQVLSSVPGSNNYSISSNPAEYFRFKQACLLDLHPSLFPPSSGVFAQGVHSGFSAPSGVESWNDMKC